MDLEIGRDEAINNIVAKGNLITYSIESGAKCHLKIFDPTGEYGAENAYGLISETRTPRTEKELIQAVDELEAQSKGQFELMEFSAGVQAS